MHTIVLAQSLRLAVLGAALLAGCESGPRPGTLRRVPTGPLWIPLPGVAVIRDSAQWDLLWRRFAELHMGDSGWVAPYRLPAVDFRREMLVAVAFGGGSGCSNEERYIQRIRERADSIVVEIGSEDDEPRETCEMFIQPVDVVRLPRSAKPVAFHSRWATPAPPPARWWDRPSRAELDRMDRDTRAAFLAALVRDPRSTLDDLRQIAERVPDYVTASILVQHPLVRNDPVALLTLMRAGDDAAGQLLFERYAHDLARDPETPPDVLRFLIERLDHEMTANHPALARLLLLHPTVRNDRELLRTLARHAQPYPAVFDQACELYLSRWSPWERARDLQGNPTDYWYSRLVCPDLPPRS